MGHDGRNARPVRRRSEEASQDVSGVEVDAELDAQRIDESDPPKWLRPAVWTGSLLLILASYVFLAPFLIFYLLENDRFAGTILVEAADVSYGPLEWLYYHSDLYEQYIRWVGDLKLRPTYGKP